MKSQMILDEIDFKLRLIKHFEKVFIKTTGNATCQMLMREQTLRLYLEIREIPIRGKALDRLFLKYKLKTWLDFVLMRPVGVSKTGGPPNVEAKIES